MPWDAWALLAILVLCGGVIVWSCWGFYRDSHPGRPDSFRLPLTGGGHVTVPVAGGRPGGRHRARPHAWLVTGMRHPIGGCRIPRGVREDA